MLRLSRDLREAAATLTPRDARYAVDLYYQLQEYRIGAAAQIRSSEGEPNALLLALCQAMQRLERTTGTALGHFAAEHREGRWAQSICGIGPVLSAGLVAHVDVKTSANVSKLWSFAGLNPTQKWSRGEKRPWNARLKVLAYKIGESFVKVQGNPRDIYGRFYAERKAREIARNEAGLFAEQAAAVLAARRYSHDTIAYASYSAGKLPPAHLHARARRYATKLFLSHYWMVAYECAHGAPAPAPWIVSPEGGGHVDLIAVPGWP